MKKHPHPPALRASSLSRLRERAGVKAIAKGAGMVLLGLIALDIVATLITVAVGAEVLRR